MRGMELTSDQIAQLSHDGSVLKLDDGRILRLRVEVDEDTTINDDDFYGKTEAYSHRYIGEEGHTKRPTDFTGNAQKIEVDRGYWMWWEPPTDGPKRGTPEFTKLRHQVTDLLRDGFKGVVLELCQGTDAYHRPIVVDVAQLWGIDSTDDGYLVEIVSELWGEIDYNQTTGEANNPHLHITTNTTEQGD